MRDLKKHELAAIEVVARRLSATWEEGGNAADAYLIVAGKRVAVEIRTLKRGRAGQGNAAKPGLRFDKVATRLMERLRAVAGEAVPAGTTVLLTITAPIRLPAKTAVALEATVRKLPGAGRGRGRGSTGRDVPATIHGNRARIRISRGGPERWPRMIGFVHNPDTDGRVLLNMAGEMLELIRSAAGRPGPGPGPGAGPRLAGERWLIVISAGGKACIEVYRCMGSQMRMAGDFVRILMVFGV